MMELQKKGPYIKDLQVLFISVDPSRDTPEEAQTYASYFHESFIGVRATQSQSQQILGALDSVVNTDKLRNPDDYKVFHPTSFFLFDPQGQWIAEIEDPQSSAEIIAGLTRVVVGKSF